MSEIQTRAQKMEIVEGTESSAIRNSYWPNWIPKFASPAAGQIGFSLQSTGGFLLHILGAPPLEEVGSLCVSKAQGAERESLLGHVYAAWLLPYVLTSGQGVKASCESLLGFST